LDEDVDIKAILYIIIQDILSFSIYSYVHSICDQSTRSILANSFLNDSIKLSG